jgi:hypothetical protein
MEWRSSRTDWERSWVKFLSKQPRPIQRTFIYFGEGEAVVVYEEMPVPMIPDMPAWLVPQPRQSFWSDFTSWIRGRFVRHGPT